MIPIVTKFSDMFVAFSLNSFCTQSQMPNEFWSMFSGRWCFWDTLYNAFRTQGNIF